MWIAILLAIPLFSHPSASSSCPRRQNTSDPHFVIEPLNVTHGITEQTILISCCIDGFTKLQWNYRHLNHYQWGPIITGHDFTNDDNTTLMLTAPYKVADGYYQCNASDTDHQELIHSIFVYLMHPSDSRNLTLDPRHSSNNLGYYIGQLVNLTCRAHTYIPDKHIDIRWYHTSQNGLYNISNNLRFVITNYIDYVYNRSEESNPDFVFVETNLTIHDLNYDDKGHYQCHIKQNEVEISADFNVDINLYYLRNNLIIGLVSCGVVGLGLIWIVWYNLFRIIIFIKTYFNISKKGAAKEIDVGILHSDADDASIWLSHSLAQLLESRGFSCWFLERDKKYGSDLTSNVSEKIQNCHLVMVVLSLDKISNLKILENLAFCSLDPSLKRLYLLSPSRKSIKKAISNNQPNLYGWFKDEFRLQFMFLSTHFSWNSRSKVDIKTIVTWILVSLPSYSIRRARNQLINRCDQKPLIN